MSYTLSPKTLAVLRELEALLVRRASVRHLGYTLDVGVSDEPDTIPHGPAVPAYSRTAGPSRTHGSKT